MQEPQADVTAETHEDDPVEFDAEMEKAFSDAAQGLSGEPAPKPAADQAKPQADPKASPDANAFVAEKTKELAEKAEDAEPKPGEKKPEEKPKTARELAEARAAELTKTPGAPPAGEGGQPQAAPPESAAPKDGGKPAPQPEPPAVPPKPAEAAPAGPTPFQVTADDVKYFMSNYGNAPLPEGDIPVPGGTVNLKAFVEEFPTEAAAIRVLGGRQAEHIVQSAIESGFLVTKADVEKLITQAVEKINPIEGHVQTLRAQLAAENTFREIEAPTDGSQAHADVRQVVRSPEWKEFIAGLSPALKVVANSPDIKDARIILELFKETRGAAAASAHDAKAAEKKKKADALLAKTVRSSVGSAARTSGLSGAVDENDFEGAFNATVEKLAAKK